MDNNFVAKHAQILNDYVHFNRPLDELRQLDEIRGADWDYPALAILTRQSLIEVLNKYLAKKITEKDLYDWASGINGRETIAYEDGYSEPIIDILNEIMCNFPVEYHMDDKIIFGYIEQLENAKYRPSDE